MLSFVFHSTSISSRHVFRSFRCPQVQLSVQWRRLSNNPPKDGEKPTTDSDPQERTTEEQDPTVLQSVDSAVAKGLTVFGSLIAAGGSLFTGAVSQGSSLASKGIQYTGASVKKVLPPLVHKEAALLPAPVERLLKATNSTARLGASAVKGTISTVTDIGATAGTYSARALSKALDLEDRDASRKQQLQSVLALKALSRTSAETVRDSMSTLGSTSATLVSSSLDTVGDVVEHTLGSQVGGIVKDSLASGKDVYDAYLSVHGINSTKLLKKMGKSAQKTALQELSALQKSGLTMPPPPPPPPLDTEEKDRLAMKVMELRKEDAEEYQEEEEDKKYTKDMRESGGAIPEQKENRKD